MKQPERNFWLDVSLFVTFLSTVFTGLLLWLVMPNSNPSVFAGIDRLVRSIGGDYPHRLALVLAQSLTWTVT
jgi:fructose-specific phosphotransferase system IIC component